MSMPRAKRPSRVWAVAASLVGLLEVGCASVDAGPFTQFAASLQPLRDGSDSQVAAVADAAKADLIQKVIDGEVSPADLQLQFDGFTTTYGFAGTEPNYPKLIRFRQGLAALNDAMIAYAQSLVALSGGGAGGDILPSSAEYDQMAQSLNANAGTAASALGINVSPGNRGLLSTVAVQLFKAYLESKRREDLQRAIAEVQPRVAEFATAAQNAVAFLGEMVETEYDKKILPLATATPPNAKPILALNEATQATLGALASLAASYGALPSAHRDLSAATAKKPGALAGLIALTEEATRLQGFVIQLAQANAAAAAGAAQDQ